MNIIPLTHGMFAVVDSDVADEMSKHKWMARRSNGGWYAARAVWMPTEKKCRQISMHRLIAGATKGQFVDHIDGDTLNNKRENLRICTNAQNLQNMRAHKGRSTKGVHFTKKRSHLCNPWHAYITLNRKRKHLGYFSSAESAQAAYNTAADELFGEFARKIPAEVAA